MASTRRQMLMQGAAVGLGALASRGAKRSRVAVIGAGTGGVAAAYFLAGTHDVEVFEARGRIGGHCDSRVIDYRGHRVTVDLGAQFFHPDTHPLYVTLLEQLGLDRQTRASEGSLCIFPMRGNLPPRFTSTHPLDTLDTALAFASFTKLARDAVIDGLGWDVTVREWVASLPLDAGFKADVLFPWITATIGCPRAEAARVSARSILQTFALAFPEDPAAGAKTYTSRIGLQGNLRHVLREAPGVRVHRDAPVRSLTRTGDGWMLRTPAGRRGPFDHVVVNAPPRVTRELLRPLPAFRRVTALLDRYAYFDSRLVIHRDPVYMARDRANWTAYNAGVDGRECEGSAWIGALHDPLPSGATVDVFKSWAQRRRADPERILLERRFQHPLITPRAIDAARALRSHQGRHGVHFSGAFTTGSDLQETALYSAMQVAEALAPRSPRLTSLRRRLRAKGIAGISYDL